MPKVFRFSTGNLYFIDTSVVVPTPIKCGTVQDVSQEYTFKEEELFGQNLFADAVGRSQGKISMKAKIARFRADLLAMFFNVTPTTGQILPVTGEVLTIPDTPGPYTVVTAAGFNFHANLGLVWKDTGAKLDRVADSPATGQYSLVEATGTFTFAAADKLKQAKADYLKISSLVGKTVTIVNQEAGLSPSFMAILYGTFEGQSVVQILNKCRSSKLSLPYKTGSFSIPEFDFSASGNNADEIGLMSLPE